MSTTKATVAARPPLAATIGICGRNRTSAVLHGSDRVRLSAREHHHIITTVGYFLLGTASLVASIAP
jgi:hypothetical protein